MLIRKINASSVAFVTKQSEHSSSLLLMTIFFRIISMDSQIYTHILIRGFFIKQFND
jgi:hypothetical protein